MKRYCLALDLKPDPTVVNSYKIHHEKIWPEIAKSIKDSGILNMEIWLVDYRLFMIVDAEDDFSFERKTIMDAHNPKVAEWEQLMWTYQQALPTAQPGEKWKIMEKIFDLSVQ